MKSRHSHLLLASLFLSLLTSTIRAEAQTEPHRYLYVATPGIRDLLEYGGHGVVVFDIDNGFKFVRRIKASGVDAKGKPVNVKGICASAVTGRLYVGTNVTLSCFDLSNDAILWEKPYPGGCDRMSITPDGKTIYLPSFEGPHWHVVDAATGDIVAKISPGSGAHNTVVGQDGSKAYLAGLKSPLLEVVDTATNKSIRQVGPFSKPIRPFTVNGRQTLVFACVNDLLGFEIGDIATGKVLHRVEVEGFKKGPVARHGCPSHGIGMTPDEREIWVCDGHNKSLHVFDLSTMPPKQVASVTLRDDPGWVTFSLDGHYAIASTGEAIDVKTRKVVASLSDETGKAVHSEKVVEIQFAGGKVTRAGDQFGVGRVVDKKADPTSALPDPFPGMHRILFLGDSITYDGKYIDAFDTALRLKFPGRHYEIINCGLSSETVSGLSEEGHAGGKFPRPDLHERLDRVLKKVKPDLVFACYGMNDGIYLPLDKERFEKFKLGTTKLHDKAIASGAKIIHLTPPIFDPTPIAKKVVEADQVDVNHPFKEYNAVLDAYADWMVEQRKAGWTVVDLHTPMKEALAARREKDPKATFSGDGVHPDAAGHLIMARALLRGAAPTSGLEDLLIEKTGEPSAHFVALQKRVRERGRIMTDAWLTETGHLRPMKAGLPMEEAKARAAKIEAEIADLKIE